MKRIIRSLEGEGLRARLMKGALGVAGLQIVNILFILLSGVMLARTLGPESYGMYVFVLSLITLFGLPTNAGLPTLIIRETAKNSLQKRWGYLRGLLLIANAFVIVFSIVTSLAFAWWFWGVTAESTAVILWALLLLPMVAFGSVRAATLQGLGKVIQGQIPEKIVRPIIMIALLLIMFFWEVELSPSLAIQFNLVSTFIAFVVGVILLSREIPKSVYESKVNFELKVWASSLVPLSMFAGLKIADTQLTILLLGGMSSAENVGKFRVASIGASLVTFSLMVVNAVLAPQVARLYKSGDLIKLQKIITLSVRVVFILTIPIVSFLIVFGEELVVFVFGDQYLGASSALTILCVGQMVNVSAGSAGLVLNMTGHEMLTLKGIVTALIVSVFLTILLVPTFGIIGAAIAAASSLSVWNIILVFLAYKHTGINTFLFNFKNKKIL